MRAYISLILVLAACLSGCGADVAMGGAVSASEAAEQLETLQKFQKFQAEQVKLMEAAQKAAHERNVGELMADPLRGPFLTLGLRRLGL